MSLIDKLNWRYATKKFDTETKKISTEQCWITLLSASAISAIVCRLTPISHYRG
jgi:hypothetical protein